MIGRIALGGVLVLGGCGAALAGTVIAVPPPATAACLPGPAPTGTATASPSASPSPSGPPPAAPTLTASQWAVVNTTATVAVGRQLATTQVLTSIYAAGLVESELTDLPYGDRDSLGVWQMRPSQGWGTAAQILDVTYAAGKWLDVMLTVSGWEAMAPGNLAQAVERSAFPDAYAKRVPEAAAIAATVLGGVIPGCNTPPGGAGNSVTSWALAHLNIPYLWGGCYPGVPSCGGSGTPSERVPADCSGFSGAAWYFGGGVVIPRTAADQYGAAAPVPAGQEQPGDLIFSEFDLHGPNHVMIVVTPGNPGVAVESPHTGDVTKTTSYSEAGVSFGRPA